MTVEMPVRVPAAPVEPTTPIRPSEALRLGRLIAPGRAVGELVRVRGGVAVSACALGAIGLGYGMSTSFLQDHFYWWPTDGNGPTVSYPCACARPRRNRPGYLPDVMTLVLAHLSDSHGGKGNAAASDWWPSARIADWLESLGL